MFFLQEDSVSIILSYIEDKIDPYTAEWDQVFDMLTENFLKQDTRVGVKGRVLATVTSLYSRYRHKHEVSCCYRSNVLSLILCLASRKVILINNCLGFTHSIKEFRYFRGNIR